MGGSAAGSTAPVALPAKQHIFPVAYVVHSPLEGLDPSFGVTDGNEVAGGGIERPVSSTVFAFGPVKPGDANQV